jgi:hypothetical protein
MKKKERNANARISARGHHRQINKTKQNTTGRYEIGWASMY